MVRSSTSTKLLMFGLVKELHEKARSKPELSYERLW